MGIGRPWGQKTGNLKLIDLKEASPLGHTRLTCVRLSYRSLDTPCRKMCLAARSASAGNGQGGDAHAIYIDGILIRASNLVNGVTIMADAKPDALSLTYFHIELDTHEPILAEGLAVESYQRDNLHAFDNADEYISLYGPAGEPSLCANRPLS